MPSNRNVGAGLILRDAAFTGALKLVRKPTGYKKSRRPTGSGFAGLRERTSPAPFDVSVTYRFL